MLFEQRGASLVVHAPAKLNLFLDVLGKRTDGFHELETLMVSIGRYDTLTFTEEDSHKIRLRHFDAALPQGPVASESEIPTGAANLVVQAAELLRKYAGVDRGVRITLLKRIPVAAGLAGGSSDAAATLLALNRLWDLKLTIGQLQELASHLGSDVGFFVSRASAAVCRGRGDRVEPLPIPLGLHFVIVRPPSGLLTAVVFRNCRPAARPKRVTNLLNALRSGAPAAVGCHLYNALQQVAEELNPELKDLKSRFTQEPVLGHLMTGSGTAYFGICANRRHALSVAARLRAARAGHVFVAQGRP